VISGAIHAQPAYGVTHDPHRIVGVAIMGMKGRVQDKGWGEGLWVWVIIRKSPKEEGCFDVVFIIIIFIIFRKYLPYRTRHTLHRWEA
jgi:hypothetical protein